MKHMVVQYLDSNSVNKGYVETLNFKNGNLNGRVQINCDKFGHKIFNKDVVKFTPSTITPQIEKMLKGNKFTFGKLEVFNFHTYLTLGDSIVDDISIYFDRPVLPEELENLTSFERKYNDRCNDVVYQEYKNYLAKPNKH